MDSCRPSPSRHPPQHLSCLSPRRTPSRRPAANQCDGITHTRVWLAPLLFACPCMWPSHSTWRLCRRHCGRYCWCACGAWSVRSASHHPSHHPSAGIQRLFSSSETRFFDAPSLPGYSPSPLLPRTTRPTKDDPVPRTSSRHRASSMCLSYYIYLCILPRVAISSSVQPILPCCASTAPAFLIFPCFFSHSMSVLTCNVL